MENQYTKTADRKAWHGMEQSPGGETRSEITSGRHRGTKSLLLEVWGRFFLPIGLVNLGTDIRLCVDCFVDPFLL